MSDIYDNKIICNRCDNETLKAHIVRDGFKIRAWTCKPCNQVWEHPSDKQDYENFSRIRNKRFRVKLRMVGNSYTVSIPKEIIEFEKDMIKELENMDKIVRMSLEKPRKLSLFFYDED